MQDDEQEADKEKKGHPGVGADVGYRDGGLGGFGRI